MNTNIITGMFILIICFSGTAIKAANTKAALQAEIPEYLVATYTVVLSAAGKRTRVNTEGTCTIKMKGYRILCFLF